MSFEKFGRITIEEIRANAPEDANLYWHRTDGDLDHKIIYYRLDKTGHLAFHADSDNTWPPCQNPEIIPQLKILFEKTK
ncbi:hypothetical protein [Acinetobacter sp. IK40]|uniref:hypothetical protein n=1 Tax=Acinetobacter sp. IK40 TaxID=2928897 RepID=UPI002D1F731D|nr:hypothetical protein [Acinetobacter sp. IK40]MEB3790128.1 hypothetical protein [Acinetobacter sp. IK40]